jgi:hypothetical protein
MSALTGKSKHFIVGLLYDKRVFIVVRVKNRSPQFLFKRLILMFFSLDFKLVI